MVFSKILDNLTSLISSKKNEKTTKKLNSEKINELNQGMIYLQKKRKKLTKYSKIKKYQKDIIIIH